MTRRRLFGTLAWGGAVACLAPFVHQRQPILYGDGKHDDTAAMQAWLDGRQVRGRDGRLLGRTIEGGSFVISGPLVVTAPNTTITQCMFTVRNA